MPSKATKSPPRKRPKARPGTILVGTASWTDSGFIEDWYPPDVAAKERLAWYAEHFNLVEVNSSFYAIPSPRTVASWAEQTTAEFVFDLKLHRLLSRHSTQIGMLPRDLRPKGKDAKSKVKPTQKLETAMAERFLESAAPLAEAGKLGALLLQLSPSFSPRKHRLEELDHVLDVLKGHKVAVELRNRTWLADEEVDDTIAYFRKRKIAFVTVDGPEGSHFMIMPKLDVVTTPKLAYLRAHGRNREGYVRGRSVAERFDYDYPIDELEEIADRAEDLAAAAGETHIIFNNNKSSYAPKAAERFRRILAERVPAPG
ncbi:MAG: DUF72 domain-containing protein [Planctomycetes bacterium]|nr:DUF72 domain-containing protein [Planctomycetota bacterium]